jgi:hypothetical protein
MLIARFLQSAALLGDSMKITFFYQSKEWKRITCLIKLMGEHFYLLAKR